MLKVEVNEDKIEFGHDCLKCGYLLDEAACVVFDQLT